MDADVLADLFRAFGRVQARRMFGGLGVYADGRMIGLVVDDVLYLKADAALADVLAARGSRPFTYDRGERRVSVGYWSAPEAALDDPDDLASLARAALAVAAARPARAPRRRPARD